MIDRTLEHMRQRTPLLFAKKTAAALGLLALSAVTTGCAPKDPIMRVNGSSIKGGQLVIGTFPFPRASVDALMEVYVSAENPNGFDVQVRGVRGQVMMMNGRYVLPINMALGNWLRAESTTPFNIPVNVPLNVGLGILRESVTMACVPYTVQGVADVTATSTFQLEKNNYPFSQAGCIPRQALLAAFPGG
jgi:hypothetical protein